MAVPISSFWYTHIGTYTAILVAVSAGFCVFMSGAMFLFRRNTRYRALRRIGTVRRKKHNELILTTEDLNPWWPKDSNREMSHAIASKVKKTISESYEIMMQLGPYYEKGENFPLFGWGVPDSIAGEVAFNRAYIRHVEQTIPRISNHVSLVAPAPIQAQRPMRTTATTGNMKRREMGRQDTGFAFGVGSEMRASCQAQKRTLCQTENEEISTYLRRLHSDCPGMTAVKGPCLRTADLYVRARFNYEPIDEKEYRDGIADVSAILSSSQRVERFTKTERTESDAAYDSLIRRKSKLNRPLT